MRGQVCLAIAIIALLFICAHGISEPQAQDGPIPPWFDVEQTKSAIVFVASGDVRGAYFSLQSGNEVLDAVKWITSLSFIRQYRIEPGRYEISTPWLDKPVPVDAIAGEVNVLKFQVIDGKDLRARLIESKSYKAGILLERDYHSEPALLSATEWARFALLAGVEPSQLWPVQYIYPKARELHFVPRRRPPPPPPPD